MIEFNNEYKEASKKFRKVFGYSVPTSMIPPTTDNATLIKYIEECISEGKDTLLEKYGVEIDEEMLI